MKHTKIISEYFKSISQAENYQFNLYNKFNDVKLISFPLCNENGLYQWKVIY